MFFQLKIKSFQALESQSINFLELFSRGYYFVIPINVLFCRPFLIQKNPIKDVIFLRKNDQFQTSWLFLMMNLKIYLLRSIALTSFLAMKENGYLF